MTIQNRYAKLAYEIAPSLFGILVAMLITAFALYFGILINATPKISLADYIQLLILLFIAATMGAGIWSHGKTEQFRRSEARLGNAIELVDRARAMLTSANGELTNDRVSWVTAARLLTRAQQIALLISVDVHRKIFEAEHDYQRHLFGDILKLNGSPLPAAFFCGSDDSSLSLGQAACHPSQDRDGANWIPTRIIAVIYRFFQYPDGYEDPLDTSKALSKKEIDRLWLFGHRGVCDYLTFRKHFVAAGRTLRQMSTEAGRSRYVTAAEIDAEMANLYGLDD